MNRKNEKHITDISIEERIADMLDDVLNEDDEQQTKDLNIPQAYFINNSENFLNIDSSICANESLVQDKMFKNDINLQLDYCLFNEGLRINKLITISNKTGFFNRNLSDNNLINSPETNVIDNYNSLLINRVFSNSNIFQANYIENSTDKINDIKLLRESKNSNNLITNFNKNQEDIILNGLINIKDRIETDHMVILKGNIFKLITSQQGSRVFQRTILNTEKELINLIFEEIKDKIHELMINSYANYFCQQLYKLLYQKERLIFLNNVI